MPEADDSLPRLLGGRYRLEAKLGSGGMGVVYRAVDTTMHRNVAVKLIRGVDGVALDEEVAGRFLREAKNTARIQHENIIEVYDFGRSEAGDMFFVMELLEGESLSARLRRETKLPVDRGVHVSRQMCAALHVAHTAGIIHRDLKPANVMLIQRAGDIDYVKVLDFGVAKSYAPDQQTELTHTGMLVGTVEYMAPEQIMGRKVDGRTDIYALGVLMYRLFSGKTPFRDGGVPALIHAHLNVLPKPMNERDANVPGALDRVVLRCLAKRPEQRFESMEELSRAIAQAIEPEDLGLMSFEYSDNDGGDPYSVGDKTEVARPPSAALAVARPAPADETFDDATMRIDRRDAASNRYGAPKFNADESMTGTEVMPPRDEVSTAKRPIPDEITRVDQAPPRECAMCKTMNAPHARACSACGVSLGTSEQEAVRARVTAPRAVHTAAPKMPPPNTGGYPNVAPNAPSAHAGPIPQHGPNAPPGPNAYGAPGAHVVAGSTPPGFLHAPPRPPQPSHHAPAAHSGSLQGITWGSLPPQQPPPKSVWERFLSWTGIRR